MAIPSKTETMSMKPSSMAARQEPVQIRAAGVKIL
jgi:hypothetical protein